VGCRKGEIMTQELATRCGFGHEWNEKNTAYRFDGRKGRGSWVRQCKPCKARINRAFRARRKAEKAAGGDE
jgi:hypothetical protein